MNKIFFTVFTAVVVLSCLLVSTIDTNAAKTIYNSYNNQQSEESQIKNNKELISGISSVKSSTSSSLQKSKPIIVDGELDIEPDTKMTKDQDREFKECKKEEKQRRSKRNSNKPTACRKVPTAVHEELTDQDYTILIDQIQEKQDTEDKKDMNIELPLDSFINIRTISTNSSVNSNISSNSENYKSSSSVVLSSNLSNSSATSIYSQHSSTIPNQNLASSSVQSSQSENSNNIAKTSFLDLLFPSIKAEAAGIVSNDYRFPYPYGVRIKTNYTFNNGITHPGHNAIDFYSINKDTGVKYNENIVAAKSGTVYLSNPSTSQTSGIGENIVIRQDDGNYALYAHMSSRSVSVGSYIARGQKIGVQGDTGTYLSWMDNSHLHFEVLQSDIINYNTACTTNFNNCYNAFTLDRYKVVPQYDECFPSRGGLAEDEIDCKLDGVNLGYPYKLQSLNYWTSINSANTNNYNGFIKANSNNQLVFDIDQSNLNNQAPIKLAQGKWAGASENQRWGYDTNTREIKGMNNKCLDAGLVDDQNNRWLRMQSCSGNNNQKWERDSSNRIHTMANTEMCIDAFGGATSGATVGVWWCGTQSNQQWNVADLGMSIPATITDLNINTILPPQPAWWKLLDFGCKTDNNSRVYIWDRVWDNNLNTCQKMRYNSNNYTITNPYGKCMDAGDLTSSNNRWLRFSTCNNGNNQKWLQESQSKGGRIWSFQKNNSNQVVCIEYYNLENNSGMDVNPCNGNQNQKWYPDLGIINQDIPSAPTSNYKTIKSYTNSGYGFNLYGGGDGNQTPIKLWTLSGYNNELFSFEASGEIKNKISGKCIDSGNVNDPNNRWLRIEPCHGGSNQRFYQDANYRIHVNANTNLCIDSAYGNSQGSMLYMYNCTSGTNQQWQLN